MVRTLEGHRRRSHAVAVTPDGHRVVRSVTERCGCGTWRAAERCARSKATARGQRRGNNARLVARGLGLGTTHCAYGTWRPAKHSNTPGHTDWVSALAVMPEGHRVISASGDQTLRVWDLESGRDGAHTQRAYRQVNAVAVTADGRRAVSSLARSNVAGMGFGAAAKRCARLKAIETRSTRW